LSFVERADIGSVLFWLPLYLQWCARKRALADLEVGAEADVESADVVVCEKEVTDDQDLISHDKDNEKLL
jgi:hypothetical protein